MKSTTGTNCSKAKALTQPLAVKDITAIIRAGKLANCSQIEYNGLKVTYNTPPQSVVAVNPWATTDHTATDDSQTQQPTNNPIQIEPDMDALLLQDPVEYERLVQSEDIDVKP
jgi:hypothetical protein